MREGVYLFSTLSCLNGSTYLDEFFVQVAYILD